jgi:hypothetical protein
MKTTLRRLAVIVLLAFICINPLIIGGLVFTVYVFGRALTQHSPTKRYSAVGIMALAGACFLQLAAAVFPATWLLLPFTIALTVVAARSILTGAPTDKPVVAPPSHDDIIDVEVISVKTIEHE